MRARVALIIALVSCGGGEPSKADQMRAKAKAACEKGDAEQCFVATSGLDPMKRDQLQRAVTLWQRGCELGHAASCAQLGTVEEFGMASGGKRSFPETAQAYYRMACKRGDVDSCKRTGMPLPDGAVDPDARATKFPWREALTPICGNGHGELGPLFDGLVLGQPMPDAMKPQVAAFEKKYKARVHYYPGDPTISSNWSIDVWFDEKAGIENVLVAGWGKPDLRFGAWTSEKTHVVAYWMHNDRETGVSWSPYRSVAEVIRPDDKELLGFEPGFSIVGAKLADLQAALGARLAQIYVDEYQWKELGATAGFEVHVTVKGGVVVKLRTQNWLTNDADVGAQLLAALEQKWGAPKIGKAGLHTWRLKGRTVTAATPYGANFELAITTH